MTGTSGVGQSLKATRNERPNDYAKKEKGREYANRGPEDANTDRRQERDGVGGCRWLVDKAEILGLWVARRQDSFLSPGPWTP